MQRLSVTCEEREKFNVSINTGAINITVIFFDRVESDFGEEGAWSINRYPSANSY